ncbi:MAG TPA: cell wall hydrolase [Geminicoccaceae bacterium]|nr:cell wall hydrolase [Geminicoccus sp.]HMU52289.1 cell wall hydrolase [Geminicoccaceae bacterium]
MSRVAHLLLSLLGLLLVSAAARAELPVSDREARCLAMIAFAEAASEGRDGMAAVIRVVRNRKGHSSFPSDACAVALQDRQFQPVSESPALKRALADPDSIDLDRFFGNGKADRAAMATARTLAAAKAGEDPTKGALYFVNPRFMDPRHCSWFATLKRTTEIGGHVFMTHYAAGEERGGPALDCATAGKDFGKGGFRLPKLYATGPFDPRGPRLATRTATPAMIRAWKRTGQYEKRIAIMKKRFKPGWYGDLDG